VFFPHHHVCLQAQEETEVFQVVTVASLGQGSATFFELRTGLKMKFFRGPAFEKPHMFSNEYLLQLM